MAFCQRGSPVIQMVCGKKLFGGGRVWGVGCGVWGFTSFEVVSYLIFWEKVQGFSPRSPQWLTL
ncbi:MAG: hypothetical protein EWV92_17400 [Microcystis aeruginosa Ma_MB_S_20031200_S102]|uniref:Type IV pilin PilA n=1 Tax=Microcystis aeruginosa Ma_MB_S_20031200_S102 TaxID=2486254 RepID=A0A552EFD9_MICAE|nr:MAG: hypothetical protein EWV79_21015 [Microcystis aeruginosa Ma_MB_S_20031200_S102D]TRU33216.1 MAG: hypothetical protein EWV92_17400 [Microcystis aeruginosa Ma_MB_S_20031200_S102]